MEGAELLHSMRDFASLISRFATSHRVASHLFRDALPNCDCDPLSYTPPVEISRIFAIFSGSDSVTRYRHASLIVIASCDQLRHTGDFRGFSRLFRIPPHMAIHEFLSKISKRT